MPRLWLAIASLVGVSEVGLACQCKPNWPAVAVNPDAAYVSIAPDAGPVTPCEAACNAMAALCGTQRATCLPEMEEEDSTRAFRTPSGQPRTCALVAAATTAGAMVALGVACP
jgi:hypothetical protein